MLLITLILSVVSLIVIAIVTVALINRTQKMEANRKMELSGLVKQINTDNEKNYQLELKQNDILNTLDGKIGSVSNDLNLTRGTLSQVSNNVDAHTRVLNNGTFNSLNLNGKSLISHEKDALEFRLGGNPVVGFDAVNGKRVLIGQSLELKDDIDGSIINSGSKPLVIGDALTLKQGKTSVGDLDVNGKLTYGGKDVLNIADNSLVVKSGSVKQNPSDIGLMIHKNKLGVGMSPEYSLDVDGDIAARTGSLYLGSNVAVSGIDSLTLNPGGQWQEIHLNSEKILLGNQTTGANFKNPMGFSFEGDLYAKSIVSHNSIKGTDINVNNLKTDGVTTKSVDFLNPTGENWKIETNPMGQFIVSDDKKEIMSMGKDGVLKGIDAQFETLSAINKITSGQFCTGAYACLGNDEVNYVVNATKTSDQKLANMQNEIDRIKSTLKI